MSFDEGFTNSITHLFAIRKQSIQVKYLLKTVESLAAGVIGRF